MTARTVADIMNPKLLYIREGDRPTLVRAKILEFGVTAVPVLDDSHRPVGVISLRDLEHTGDLVPSAPACTVPRTASIRAGAKELAAHNVHHLVVVDEQGVAVGMVSAVDFVRALVGAAADHPPAFARF